MDQEQNRHIAYSPLNKDKKEFRLVRILDDPEGMRCVMNTFSLENPPSYRAASYCWTDHAPTCTIALTGEAFSIRPNLYHFLRRMQGERHFGWFFIDALCINQSDTEERPSQVEQMGDIYRNAAEVFIWLGGDYAFKVPDGEGGKPIVIADYQKLAANLGMTMSDLFASNSTLSSELKDLLAYAITLECMWSDYWLRLWVVQEILLAKRLYIWSGHCALEWEVFEIAFSRKWSLSYAHTDHHDVTSTILTTWYMNRSPGRSFLIKFFTTWTIIRQRKAFFAQFQARQPLPLSEFLSAYIGTECSLIHDKVFGLYGVAQNHISVDYSMPVLELYVRSLAEVFLAKDLSATGKTGEIKDQPDWWPDMTAYVGLARSFEFESCETIMILVNSFLIWIERAHRGLTSSATFLSIGYISAAMVFIHSNFDRAAMDPISKPFRSIRRRARKLVTIRRFHSCRKKNAVVSISNNSLATRTYKEWLCWMSSIILDVYERMDLEDIENKKSVVSDAVQAFSSTAQQSFDLRELSQ